MGTGQMVWQMTVRNAGESACALTGYPRLIALGADGKVLPVTIHDGDKWPVNDQPPARVAIRPGGTAFAAVSELRCDLPVAVEVQRFTVILPAVAAPATPGLAGPDSHPGYCGPGDPGSDLAVSPLEPTAEATLRRL